VDISARLIAKVQRCLRSLEGAAGGLVVAVSGGPDSVALVRALVAARPEKEPVPLVLAHLNHQLRGAESNADEDFVVRLHASLVADGIPCLDLCRHRLNVGAEARREGANLEALARQRRYQWLAEVARSRGRRWVATGHTANDQAETVLHRLLRGTGLQGLRGIAARRELGEGVGVVRPLLLATRNEILAFLDHLGQPFCQDSSNADLRHTRNRIRHELLPLLAERYNPRVVEVLTRLAGQAEEAFGEEERAGADLLRESELPRAGSLVILDRARLVAASRRAVRTMFRLLWAREGWPMDPMGYESWERLAALAAAGSGALDLPGRIRVRSRERVVQLERVGTP
jgi:tRNA(Ile)-lysidine synthase